MKKPGEVVLKETGYIACFVAILSVIMQAIFAFCGYWNYTVLLGNILSAVFAVANFLLMGMSVEKAVEKDSDEAKKIVKTSQSLRQLMLLAVAAMGAILPWFDIWATVIPLVFPRIAIALRPLFGKDK